MTAGVDISCSGQFDIQTSQASITGTGTGQIFRVAIPQTIPGSNRFFIVESMALYITDENVGGTLAKVAMEDLAGSPLGFIVPASSPAAPGSISSGPPAAFNFPSIGSAVALLSVFTIAGAGTSRSAYILESNRKIYVPQGYLFGAYVVEPADAAPHVITATMISQVRWFDL